MKRVPQGPIMSQPLAELFSVSINPSAGKCELYGSIYVEDSWGTVVLYNRERLNADLIDKTGILNLTNTGRSICGLGDFTVYFDLKERNGDVEFIRGTQLWSLRSSEWDSFLHKEIKGGLGSAVVSGSVFSSAVQATVLVNFYKRSGDFEHVNVSGNIIAEYHNMYDFAFKGDMANSGGLSLFKNAPEQSVLLKPEDNNPISLSRSVVTVPAYGLLRISLDLQCEYSNGLSEHIKNDDLRFPAWWYNHYFKEDIHGDYGLLRLEVQWTSNTGFGIERRIKEY